MSDKQNSGSDYPELAWPNFEVSIAAPILSSLSPQEQWLYGTIDVMRQNQEHIVQHLKESQKIHYIIDKRLLQVEGEDRKRIAALEEWKEKFNWRWAIISTLGTAAVVLLITRFVGNVWDHIFVHKP